MIGNIGVMGAAQTGGPLGGEGGGGEIQGPENHSGCSKSIRPVARTRHDFGPIACQVAGRLLGHASGGKGAASCPSHVVEASAGVEVMAAAGASANRSALTVAAVGQDVATGTDDSRLRTHTDLRRVIRSE